MSLSPADVHLDSFKADAHNVLAVESVENCKRLIDRLACLLDLSQQMQRFGKIDKTHSHRYGVAGEDFE
ncbi:hypothetical protein GCM10010971_26540 [Silvimonas amylolytica]|uniref:Uncharacterized protein n=1 Tax=Silvimonas amylolytica TaxID=449663 RepID=A0ABQ2PNK7_9NEIS|nr:hypothetical protein GCM10010971_26540 [Silvimonas amylolytica]